MRYNKHNLRVSDFAQKKDTGRELQNVLFTDKYTLATDSFKLVKVTTPKGDYPADQIAKPLTIKKQLMIPANIISSIKTPARDKHIDGVDSMVITERKKKRVTLATVDFKNNKTDLTKTDEIEGKYPDVGRIIKDAKKNAKHTVLFDPRHMVEIMKAIVAFQERNPYCSVKMSINGSEPILIEAEGGEEQKLTAILMPMRK